MKSPFVCTVCGSENLKKTATISVKYGGKKHKEPIFYCKLCSHRFFPSNPKKQVLIEQSYNKDYTGFREDSFFIDRVEIEIKQQFISRLPPPAKILDVGCGNGMFMKKAEEMGYKVDGIDISTAAIVYCKNKGLNVYEDDFISCEFDNAPYDFVTMWDVVEHLREPQNFIKKAKSILSENGILVLKIPGFNALTFRVLSIYSNGAGALLGAPDHIQYFNKKSLGVLLNESGFLNYEFLETGDFRQTRITASNIKKAKRIILKSIHSLSGDKNLYVFAK